MGYCDVLSRTPGRVQVHNKRWQVAFLGSNQRAELCKKERCSRETWSLALTPSAGSGQLGAVAADCQEGVWVTRCGWTCGSLSPTGQGEASHLHFCSFAPFLSAENGRLGEGRGNHTEQHHQVASREKSWVSPGKASSAKP